MTRPGRHFLQIPGPTNVPDRVLRAMDLPTVDHRGPDFARLTLDILDALRPVFQTRGPIAIFPSSGTGACEAALANTLSPGDRILVMETGWFSHIAWRHQAEKLGLRVDYAPGTWRRGASPEEVEERLRADTSHAITAVVVVHNETSTGVTSRIGEVRRAMTNARHPALLIVDTISSLASIDYRHDEWEVDVTVAGSQKGLMLPPGLGFNAMSDKALAAGKTATMPRSYWDWEPILKNNASGFYPYTPATNLLYGLREALAMLHEEGLARVFRRHRRHAEATRAAAGAWGLEVVCEDPREYSGSLTAIFTPEGHDADRLRAVALETFDMSLGTGLGKLAGKAFRIGHLGSFNDLMLAGTLAGVEMGLRLAGVPHRSGGVMAALDVLSAPVGEPVMS
ncbi:MAG: serine--glyoxylate aminotransferase [Acidobacteria bacterium RIFCSPLOWO2_02_FULL_68_18]|nr:MAG: serine--glyoxylate aminotransferase [Acidobacteria bacterium RIFCSPLOWO2_02_FULL_68_18]OFW51388.1 MAG: serine--glyoxylate aminotransferase [Acidobacteria bacterium RIFCSPLOWO2_12_FULL_68_19]